VLQRMLQRTDVEGDKVHVKYSRGGTIYTTTLVRTSADRIQSIRSPDTTLPEMGLVSLCVGAYLQYGLQGIVGDAGAGRKPCAFYPR
jgi:hypothetical protein